VTDYGASAGSGSDQAGFFQDAIDAAYAAGRGGVVFVPPGVWKMTSQITLYPGVILMGSGYGFDQGDYSSAYEEPTFSGTIISVEWGSGSGSESDVTKAAVIMNPGSTVTELMFNYPNQVASNSFTPTEWGACIKLYLADTATNSPYHSDCIISNVMFYKSWTAIDMRGDSARTSGTANMTTHRVQDVNMATLRWGIRVQNITDWMIFDKVEQQPGWLSANTFGPSASLRDYVQKNCVMFDLHDLCDWFKATNCMAWTCNAAAQFTDVTGPVTWVQCDFDAMRTSVFYIQGTSTAFRMKAVGCTFTCFDAIQNAAGSGQYSSYVVAIANSTTIEGLSIDSSNLFGPSKGWMWFGQATTNIDNVQLTNCYTSLSGAAGGADYAINAGTPGVNRLIMTSNILTGLAGTTTGTVTNTQIANNLT
jgi:hypothetical protein